MHALTEKDISGTFEGRVCGFSYCSPFFEEKASGLGFRRNTLQWR